MTEYKNLSPLIEAYQQYLKIQEDIDQTKEILQGNYEKDFKELAQNEYVLKKKF
jgi:protein subunit release factor A